MRTLEFTGTDRFELIRRLGEGGFGTVYEAFDRTRSARVALKLLRQAEGTALYRFKREFRALADISHPNLVSLDELLTDGWYWFFTMELVRGVSLVEYVRASAAQGSFDEARLRSTLPQLVEALHAIHQAGIVHCDVKPSNVLVTPEGRVVVLDFGLVSEQAPADDSDLLSSSLDLRVLGTPAYMAPEQATEEPVTPAADWYSVGVMMYEILTGELPFTGSSLDVLEAKRNRRPSLPRTLKSGSVKDLAVLTLALVEPDPSRRPAGESILKYVGHSDGRAPVDVQTPSVPDVLLGRGTHLRRLSDAFETAVRGESVVAFVSGSSGMGKTALVRHFLHDLRAREPDVLAFTSRCYERESMPYKAIDPLVDAVAQHLQRLSDLEVARLLPRDTAILARLFPVLLGVEEVRRVPQYSGETIDSVTLRQRAASALRELLAALAVRRPLVLVIDDLQWGDIDSAPMLQEILRPPEAPPLLLLVVYRSENAGDARLLHTLTTSIGDASQPRVYRIEVGALSDAEAQQLALQLTVTADDAAQRAAAIARESGGNAFFVHELAQHSLTVGGATTLDGVVRDRVNALPGAARRLITAVALSAQAMPIDLAADAAGLDADPREAVQLLRTSRLVRGRPDKPHIETYHDRIREAVVGGLTETQLPVWHQRIANAWERSGAARPETLVVHFDAAGDIAKTRLYAVAAAANAEKALAFDRAADFYALLVRLEDDNERRREWFISLGHALANAGRGHDASVAFLAALGGATDAEAIDLERRAASELIRSGYLDEATVVLDRLLPKVGVRPPGSDRRALMTIFLYRLLLAIRGVGYRERPESEIPAEVLRRIDVLTTISPPLTLSAIMQGSALNAQATWHALRAGEPRRVVIALTALAANTALGGIRSERHAHRLVKQAQSLAERLQDPWATGRTVLAEGIVLKLNGHWKEGAERLAQAVEIFAPCTGVRWEIETAQMLRHDALYWMGQLHVLARELPARRREAEQRGDLYSATHVAARLSPLMCLADDRMEQAQIESERGLAFWTKSHFGLQHRFLVCTDVDIALYAGDPRAADRRLAEAWPALRGMLFVLQHHRIEMLFYRARIALALAGDGDMAALRRAERDARRLDREHAPWARAVAKLVAGTCEQIRGHDAEAVASLESAEMQLSTCNMTLFAAAAQYRRGRLTGGTEGQALVDRALESMQQQQVVNPQRLARVLAPGP